MIRIFTILFLLSVKCFSQAENFNYCPHATSAEEIATIISNLKNTQFPELQEAKISLKEFQSKNSFFQARQSVGSALRKKEKRNYFVMVNKSLYDCAPSITALESILIHELQHILDYENQSTFKLAGFAISYFFDKNFKFEYERETDKKAIQRGAAAGLIEYRKWLYLRLNQKQLEKKQLQYLTPNEIQAFEDSLKIFP